MRCDGEQVHNSIELIKIMEENGWPSDMNDVAEAPRTRRELRKQNNENQDTMISL